MKQVTEPKQYSKSLLRFRAFVPLLLLMSFAQHSHAAVEGGALLKGSAFADDTTIVPAYNATSKAIKWSNLDFDTTAFDFNSSTPTRLKVKTLVIIIFRDPNRSCKKCQCTLQVHFFVKKMINIDMQMRGHLYKA